MWGHWGWAGLERDCGFYHRPSIFSISLTNPNTPYPYLYDRDIESVIHNPTPRYPQQIWPHPSVPLASHTYPNPSHNPPSSPSFPFLAYTPAQLGRGVCDIFRPTGPSLSRQWWPAWQLQAASCRRPSHRPASAHPHPAVRPIKVQTQPAETEAANRLQQIAGNCHLCLALHSWLLAHWLTG